MSCRIDYVHFDRGREDGPLRCVCGWRGLASLYDAHMGRALPPTCPKGHNEWTTDHAGYRRCVPCHKVHQANWRERKKARRNAQREQVYA